MMKSRDELNKTEEEGKKTKTANYSQNSRNT